MRGRGFLPSFKDLIMENIYGIINAELPPLLRAGITDYSDVFRRVWDNVVLDVGEGIIDWRG